MAFSDDDVQRLARLARLRLGGEESARLAGELDGIVRYVDELFALDVPAAPIPSPAPRTRPDEPNPVLGPQAVAQSEGLTSVDGGALVRVPKVIG